VSLTSRAIVLDVPYRLIASIKNAKGKEIAGETATWTTSDEGVATVDADGYVTGLELGGTATITATSGGISGTATVLVAATEAERTDFFSDLSTELGLNVGLSAQLRAIPRDFNANYVASAAIWASDDEDVA